VTDFRTPSKLTRAVAGVAALFSTVMVVAAMVGLAGYYNEQAVEVAATQPAPSTVASR
jgi:hypothetical protein